VHLLVAYDVSDDANRRRVYRTLQRYGAWKQYSVFELDISKAERVELEDELAAEIDADDGDRVKLYRLCASCESETTTLGAEPADEQSNVV
jgi:CRISPR-associated protein Cas2